MSDYYQTILHMANGADIPLGRYDSEEDAKEGARMILQTPSAVGVETTEEAPRYFLFQVQNVSYITIKKVAVDE
jgi:hypothetical protein